MSSFDEQVEYVFSLKFCQQFPDGYFRSLSPLEKVEKLVQLQEEYYQFLLTCEQNGGKPIPEKWRKWYRARFENV